MNLNELRNRFKESIFFEDGLSFVQNDNQKKIIPYQILKDKFLKVDIINYKEIDFSQENKIYKEDHDFNNSNISENLRTNNNDFYFLNYYNHPDDYTDTIIPYIHESNIKFINMNKFLHGYCDVFAYALAKKFGYKIVVFNSTDEYGNFCGLVHAFCISEKTQKYIDIRGASTSSNIYEIMAIYEDTYFEDYCSIQIMEVEESINFFREICQLSSRDYNNESLHELNEFLELFKEKYEIK